MNDPTPHAVWKRFCRMAEHKEFVRRFGPGFVKQLDTYAIFEIPAARHSEMSLDDYDVTNADLDQDPVPPFPFPKIVLLFPDLVIAVEHPEIDLDSSVLEFKAILYMIHDLIPSEAPTQREETALCMIRADLTRKLSDPQFLEMVDFRSQVHHNGKVTNYPEELDPDNDPAQQASLEAMVRMVDEDRKHVQCLLDDLEQHRRDIRVQIHRYLRACFIIGLRAIAWINRPKHFIVLQGPEIERKASKHDRDRVRRLGERSRYIIIDHEEVRRRWTVCHGMHGRPMPHLRRGHYKTLRSERYKQSRGKVIWVSPCHVNGECVQWREGAVSYKVVG